MLSKMIDACCGFTMAAIIYRRGDELARRCFSLERDWSNADVMMRTISDARGRAAHYD